MYTKKLNDGSLIILVLYVDDMLIASKSKVEITLLKNNLSKQFSMKDFGDAHHFLGMRIKRDCKRGILNFFVCLYLTTSGRYSGMPPGEWSESECRMVASLPTINTSDALEPPMAYSCRAVGPVVRLQLLPS